SKRDWSSDVCSSDLGLVQHISTLRDVSQLCFATLHAWQALAAKNKCLRAIRAQNSFLPRHCGFYSVAEAPSAYVWPASHISQLLDRLVSMAVLAQTNGVVGVHHNGRLLHQCRHTHRVASVLHKH